MEMNGHERYEKMVDEWIKILERCESCGYEFYQRNQPCSKHLNLMIEEKDRLSKMTKASQYIAKFFEKIR